jgi:hypothetical protein
MSVLTLHEQRWISLPSEERDRQVTEELKVGTFVLRTSTQTDENIISSFQTTNLLFRISIHNSCYDLTQTTKLYHCIFTTIKSKQPSYHLRVI